MIRCVVYADVEGYLRSLGWEYVGEADYNAVYRRREEYKTFPVANVFGDLPENLVNETMYRWGIPVPDFETHWCD